MWNFAGRQNDIQNVLGNSLEGNWISGIKFLDEWRLGIPQDIPVSLKYNKAHNTFFFLPLILGILGIIVMYQKSKMDFYTVFILFLFTGLLVVVYLTADRRMANVKIVQVSLEGVHLKSCEAC